MPKPRKPARILKIDGELEIDTVRGVIYFHSNESGITLLRVCSLPTPIPNPEVFLEDGSSSALDITHMHGASWSGDVAETETPEQLAYASWLANEARVLNDLGLMADGPEAEDIAMPAYCAGHKAATPFVKKGGSITYSQLQKLWGMWEAYRDGFQNIHDAPLSFLDYCRRLT